MSSCNRDRDWRKKWSAAIAAQEASMLRRVSQIYSGTWVEVEYVPWFSWRHLVMRYLLAYRPYQ